MNWKKSLLPGIVPAFLLLASFLVLEAVMAGGLEHPGIHRQAAAVSGPAGVRPGDADYGNASVNIVPEDLDPTGMFLPGSSAHMPPFPDTDLLNKMYSSKGPGNQQTWSGEKLADPYASFGYPTGDQRTPTIGFGGTKFLAVWEDLRSGNSDLYGSRLTPQGVLLDSAGIVISISDGDQSDPRIAFDGTNYLLVWQDTRNGNPDVYGALIDTSGNVVAPGEFPIETNGSAQDEISVCYGGGVYLVAWSDSRSGTRDIYGAWVSTAGAILGSGSLGIFVAAGDQEYPAIAYDGASFFVAWQDQRSDLVDSNIYGTRLLAGGTPLDHDGIPISTYPSYQRKPAITTNGSNFMVVWEDSRESPNETSAADIYGSIFTISADTLSYAAKRDSLISYNKRRPPQWNPRYQYSPQVMPSGTGFFVVWEEVKSDSSDVVGTRVSLAGAIEDTILMFETVRGGQIAPAGAWGQDECLVVWQDYRNGTTADIYGARVNTSGTVLDPASIMVSMVANDQWAPAIGTVTDGSQALLVWEDRRNSTTTDIYGVRITDNGTVQDPRSIKISSAANGQATPCVAFDGTNYLVAWSDYRGSDWDVIGTLVAQNGTVASPNGVYLHPQDANHQLAPAVAFGDTAYLAVWEQKTQYTGQYDLYGVHLRKNLSRVESVTFPVCLSYSEQRTPQIAFGATNYLVVWQDKRKGSFDIYCTTIGSKGTVPDTTGKIISEALGTQAFPSIAFDGAKYFVVWQDFRSGTSFDIYGARVDTTGNVIGGSTAPICSDTGDQTLPKVIFDGTNFLVVWQDARGTSPQIYGSRVDTSGTVLDPGGLILTYGQPLAYQPVIAKGGSGQLYTAWSSFVPTTFNSYRAWVEAGTWAEVTPVSTPSFTATPKSGEIVLSWKAYGDDAAYRVYRKGPDDADKCLLAEFDKNSPAGFTPENGNAENRFVDSAVRGGAVYSYWLGLVGKNGTEAVFGPVEAGALAASSGTPAFSGIYPNPFSGETFFSLRMPVQAFATVQVFDTKGGLVRELHRGNLAAGTQMLKWDGKNGSGKDLPSGIYFVKFKTGSTSFTKRTVIIR